MIPKGFPKAIRLRTRAQFQRMAQSGCRRIGHWLVIEIRASTLPQTRLGITVTKRYGKAHDRNRFKRLIREIFRLEYSNLPSGFDFNIKPRIPAKEVFFQDLKQEFLKLIKRKEP